VTTVSRSTRPSSFASWNVVVPESSAIASPGWMCSSAASAISALSWTLRTSFWKVFGS